MDSQVSQLLDEERKVNTQVKAALMQKREKLATIQDHTERAVANERRELKDELDAKVAQVSAQGLATYWKHGVSLSHPFWST